MRINWICSRHLGLPPRRNDPALQRGVGEGDETVGSGEVCKQAFRRKCVLPERVRPDEKRATDERPPSFLFQVRRSAPSAVLLPP